ncbi:MAG TPA: SMP-30/gluconolactonase/LRE family protein [Mycobacteriales bacterium]|nr:SMP-30/gluconolactonase/LRE family protein [Mycobacteriales bacterium]
MPAAGAVLVDGLGWPECPRWQDGVFYFTDMHQRTVFRVDEAGGVEAVLTLSQTPAGMGWLPDGRLVIVLMHERKLVTWAGGTVTDYADLTGLLDHDANDLSVGPDGRGYVTTLGGIWEAMSGAGDPPPAPIALVSPDGSVRSATRDAITPNGVIRTSTGRLVIAEPWANRVSSYAIGDDGSLADKRVLIQLAADAMPDGICMDAAGHCWIASPSTSEVIRAAPDGTVAERIAFEDDGAIPVACMLGGPDGNRLYVCVADREAPPSREEAPAVGHPLRGRIDTFVVDAVHDGWP